MGLLRSIYLYSVSFVALMITITGVIVSFNAISDIIIPESSVYDYGYDYGYSVSESLEGITARELEDENREKQLDIEVKRAQKSLINSLASVLVGSVLYMFHWKAIEKEHKLFSKSKEVKPENKIV